MKKNNQKIIVIKIGSAGLVGLNGKVRRSVIRDLARQVKFLQAQGFSVCIVTSGAVASAGSKDWSKNLRSAVGQVKLMNFYAKEFGLYGIQVAQALLTDRELEEANGVTIKNVINEAFEQKIVCIVNANDAIDSEELNALEVCSDNDKLFSLLCKKLGAGIGIIIFAEKGFRDDKGDFISKVFCQEIEKYLSYAKGGSAMGHGENGMSTKIKTLCALSQKGVVSYLVSVYDRDFVIRAVMGEKGFGTIFLP